LAGRDLDGAQAVVAGENDGAAVHRVTAEASLTDIRGGQLAAGAAEPGAVQHLTDTFLTHLEDQAVRQQARCRRTEIEIVC
jgi:hypothetical protein